MSTARKFKGDSERPPGPHRPDVQLISEDSLKKTPPTPYPNSDSKPADKDSDPKQADRQRFVLTDPVALRYLEDDPAVTVLERHRELVGYEIYVVEQWATSRSHPTFVITTYTGDPNHKAYVSVLSVPTDESTWSQRLRVYFKALNQYHARRRETPLGVTMITNLSGFPSSLTVISVPDGDLRKHRLDFFVNENLKRLGCSGRVGLSLAPPNGATVAKFHQLYRTSDKNQLSISVIELVKLCQTALHLSDKLAIDYADGLLCDMTEKAINDWWLSIGSEFYNIEPHDGVLGPTTVVALLGLLMGARNRLHAINVSVPKDPFDIAGMKHAIGSFQKSQRLNKNRRLDRETLTRLHRSSAKAASSEGWSRAVKSTVAELSGKGGEMLAEVVGRRDKAGIAEIETSDIERFCQLVYGERCRWLWHGKPLKTISIEHELADPEQRLVLESDEKGGFTWMGNHDNNGIAYTSTLDIPEPERDLEPLEQDTNKDQEVPHRSIIKRATGLIAEKRNTGFGRMKDAVGRRGHHRSTPSKGSKEDDLFSPIEDTGMTGSRPDLRRTHTSPPISPISPIKDQPENLDQAFHKQKPRPASYVDPIHTHAADGNTLVQTEEESRQGFMPLGRQATDDKINTDGSSEIQAPEGQALKRQGTTSTNATNLGDTVELPSHEPSIAGSLYHGVDLHDVLPEPATYAQDIGPLLRRTSSYATFIALRVSKPRSSDYFPRHLSFSLAEDGAAYDANLHTMAEPKPTASLEEQFTYESIISSDLMALRAMIADLDRDEGTWTRTQLYALRELLDRADRDTAAAEQYYHAPLHILQDLRDSSAGLMRDERDALGEVGKELEALAARMDYEIGGMRGKVEEVEAGVQDFERAVGAVEDRVRDLEEGEGKGGKLCVVM